MSPPFWEGWLRHQENFGAAHLSAADGVVAHKSLCRQERPLFLDGCALSGLRGLRPPSAPTRRLRGVFFMSRPPLLVRKGLRLPKKSSRKNGQGHICSQRSGGFQPTALVCDLDLLRHTCCLIRRSASTGRDWMYNRVQLVKPRSKFRLEGGKR